MEIKGRIIAVMEARSGVGKESGKTWTSQEYVIETADQYPKRCCFNVWGEDKIKEYALEVGKEYTVHFDVNAREYQGRWYNEIRAWKVETATAAPTAAPTAQKATEDTTEAKMARLTPEQRSQVEAAKRLLEGESLSTSDPSSPELPF